MVSTTNVFIKVSQIVGDLLGNFEKQHFLSKSCCLYFLDNFFNLGNFLSGHVVHDNEYDEQFLSFSFD